MKDVKVITRPPFDKKAESVALRFQLKRGQLVTLNEENDIKFKDRIKRQIETEVGAFFDSMREEINAGLELIMEKEDGTREQFEYTEKLENAVYNMVYN